MPVLHHDILLVERAVSEMKLGIPVILEDQSSALLALSVEYLDQASLAILQEFSLHPAFILLTAKRAHHLNPHISFDSSVKVPFTDVPSARKLSGLSKGRVESIGDITSASQLEQAAVALAKLQS